MGRAHDLRLARAIALAAAYAVAATVTIALIAIIRDGPRGVVFTELVERSPSALWRFGRFALFVFVIALTVIAVRALFDTARRRPWNGPGGRP